MEKSSLDLVISGAKEEDRGKKTATEREAKKGKLSKNVQL